MKTFRLLLSALMANVNCARAFHIIFNEEPLCNGTATGELDLGKDGVCHDNYSEGSLGYTISTTDESDTGNLIVFYQFGESRAEDEIAVSNAPFCVAGGFGSFKVIGVEDCCLDNVYFQDSGFQGVASDVVAQPSTTIMVSSLSSTTATTAPSSTAKDLQARQQASTNGGHPQVYHGVIRVHGNEKYKMHQVAHGVFQGVDLNDWDDSIHVKDDTKLDLSNLGLPDLDISKAVSRSMSSNALEARLFKYATCSAMLQCVYDIGTGALVGMEAAVKYLIGVAQATLARTPTGAGLWEFLNKPFVVGVLASGVVALGPGAFSGWIGAQTQKSGSSSSSVTSSVSVCSDSEDEADVVRTVIAMTLRGQHTAHVSDMTASVLLPNGQTGIISVNNQPEGDETPEVCGAPTKAP